MLILSRRPNQSIFIDKGQIKIKVLKIKGNSVSLGIYAEKPIEIDREEIYRRKYANQQLKEVINQTQLTAKLKLTGESHD